MRELDDVAYVRFASVYRNFQDIEAFQQLLVSLSDDVAKAEIREKLQDLSQKTAKPSAGI